MITLEKQDMKDLLLGCTLLGTGGGGKLEPGELRHPGAGA